jgi:YHS domain-containing protein
MNPEHEGQKGDVMATVNDPVCGMEIDSAAASEEYEGRTYYFCSEACHQRFVAAPGGTPSERGGPGELVRVALLALVSASSLTAAGAARHTMRLARLHRGRHGGRRPVTLLVPALLWRATRWGCCLCGAAFRPGRPRRRAAVRAKLGA